MIQFTKPASMMLCNAIFDGWENAIHNRIQARRVA